LRGLLFGISQKETELQALRTKFNQTLEVESIFASWPMPIRSLKKLFTAPRTAKGQFIDMDRCMESLRALRDFWEAFRFLAIKDPPKPMIHGPFGDGPSWHGGNVAVLNMLVSCDSPQIDISIGFLGRVDKFFDVASEEDLAIGLSMMYAYTDKYADLVREDQDLCLVSLILLEMLSRRFEAPELRQAIRRIFDKAKPEINTADLVVASMMKLIEGRLTGQANQLEDCFRAEAKTREHYFEDGRMELLRNGNTIIAIVERNEIVEIRSNCFYYRHDFRTGCKIYVQNAPLIGDWESSSWPGTTHFDDLDKAFDPLLDQTELPG
jgi:ferritin-like metal-binding protein YciE